MSDSKFKYIPDKEQYLDVEDLLGTKVYADTITDLILLKEDVEPFTIGLFGGWDSGKSSIVKTVENRLQTNNTVSQTVINDQLIWWRFKNMNRRHFFKFGFTGLGTMILNQNLLALKYYPMQSDKKYAVLYSTWCGSSRDAALWISEGMGGIADVFDVRENADLQDYDHIIIGGSIRGGVTSAELQEYLKRNKIWLKDKVRGLFAVCGNMCQPVGQQQTIQFIDNHLAKLCEINDVSSKVFLGRITKSLMDPQTAKMMERVEDYDNLKRSECMMFGQEVLSRIQ